MLGAAVGVAVSSTVLQTSFKQALPQRYKYLSDALYSLAGLDNNLGQAVSPAYARSVRNVFITNAAVSLVAVLCCLGWKDIGCDEKTEDSNQSGQDETELATPGEAPVELSTMTNDPLPDGQHPVPDDRETTAHGRASGNGNLNAKLD